MGLAGIPPASILGCTMCSPARFLPLAAAFAGGSFFVCWWVGASPFGRVLRAIREDEILARALGKNVAAFKVTAFILGACIASLAGVLYAHYVTFIDPTSFTVMESVFVISIVIIGGAGSTVGPVLGAIVLVSVPEILRAIGLPSSAAANVREVLYGMLLIVLMLWRPRGFLGEYAFQSKEARE